MDNNVNNNGNQNVTGSTQNGMSSPNTVENPINTPVENNTPNNIGGEANKVVEQPAPSMPINNTTTFETLANANPTNTANTPATPSAPTPSTPVMETIPDAAPSTPSTPPTSTPSTSNEVPPVTPEPTVNPVPPTTPTSTPIPDNFNAVPVPPTMPTEEPKKKKSNKKTLLVVLIIVLIAAIGFGVYYFLHNANTTVTNANIATKDVHLELGEVLSTELDDYATITGYDKQNCSLDTSEVESDSVGAYSYTITCGANSQQGSVIIDDTTKPEVQTKTTTLMPNATIKPEDFIESCIDASSCVYAFSDEATVLQNVQNIGEYDVELTVTDEYDNTTIVTAKMVISNEAPVRYLTCLSPSENVDEIYATLTNEYKFGITSTNQFFDVTEKSNFHFDDKEDYNKVVEDYDQTKGIYNKIGKAVFDDVNQSIQITAAKSLQELEGELGNPLSNDMNAIQMILTMNSYTCE